MNSGWRVKTAFAAAAKGWGGVCAFFLLLQIIGAARYFRRQDWRATLAGEFSVLLIYGVATALVSLLTTAFLLAPYFAWRSPESLVTQAWRTYLEPFALVLLPVAVLAATARASVETFWRSFLAFGTPASAISLAGSFFYTRAVHLHVKLSAQGAP